MPRKTDGRTQQALRRCKREYEGLKAQLNSLDYILQGSVTQRWKQCGKPGCRCQQDPQSRHGPYYQWSWKERGTTKSIHLNPHQAQQCREWIGNHRALERIIKRMRTVSLRAARLQEIAKK